MNGPRNSASPIPPRAFFIVGVGRSGTSLMPALLDDHPELLVLPGESRARSWYRAPNPVEMLYAKTIYGRDFPTSTGEKNTFDRFLRSRLPGPVELDEALRILVEGVLRLRPAPKATAWVEKTPKHLRNVAQLFARFGPTTRVIRVLRDPRSTYASRAKRWGHSGRADIRSFARRWACDDALANRFESQPWFQTIRYEDLIEESEATMRRVAAHLDISFDDSLLHPTRQGNSVGANSSFGSTGQGISRAPLRRYRDQLDHADVAHLEALLGARMFKHGYLDARGAAWRRVVNESTVAAFLFEERRKQRSWRRKVGAR